MIVSMMAAVKELTAACKTTVTEGRPRLPFVRRQHWPETVMQVRRQRVKDQAQQTTTGVWLIPSVPPGTGCNITQKVIIRVGQ